VSNFAETFQLATGLGTPADDGAATRRFVYVLPQGSDIGPAAGEARDWLESLGLVGEVGLHATNGVWAQSSGPDWRADMHRPAIVIGTSQALVSKALNRAFGAGPATWPIDFALVTNGAHWIAADPGQYPRAAATLARIIALGRELGTAEPLRLTLLSDAALTVTASGDQGVVRDDLPGFFDTSPDVAANWLDVAPLVSEAGRELPAGVAWATWAPRDGGAPDPEVRLPSAEHRRAVPRSAITGLAAGHRLWRRAEDGTWARVASGADVQPFEVVLARAPDGADAPVLRTPAELAALAADAGACGQPPPRPWQSVDSHSEQVRDQAAALVAVLGPDIPERARSSAVVAGYLHDAGKAHQMWQDGLCALAPEADRAAVLAGRPWAKSGEGAQGRLEFSGGVSFRHELASLLIIDGPLRCLLEAAPDPDLCRYLVLAHHGRLRTRVADSGADGPAAPGAPRVIAGLEHGAISAVPPVLGQPAFTLTVDLDQFGDAGDRDSLWSRTVSGLLGKYGPFRLAYLETLVRMADWRASAGLELPR
jgi:CRISPR-associated endonuclease Cas3-HD